MRKALLREEVVIYQLKWRVGPDPVQNSRHLRRNLRMHFVTTDLLKL